MFIVEWEILFPPALASETVEWYLGSFITILAKREGANAMTGRDNICSSMGGSLCNTGNLGFRFDPVFLFCFGFDGDNSCFDFLFCAFIVSLSSLYGSIPFVSFDVLESSSISFGK